MKILLHALVMLASVGLVVMGSIDERYVHPERSNDASHGLWMILLGAAAIYCAWRAIREIDGK